MRRFVLSLLLSGILAMGAVSPGVAAPSDSRISVAAHAQFVSPTTIEIPVTYVCPESFVSGFVAVAVTQEETGGRGSAILSVPCTSEAETVVVTVNGGPFTPGRALAHADIFGGFFGDSRIRRIQIVL